MKGQSLGLAGRPPTMRVLVFTSFRVLVPQPPHKHVQYLAIAHKHQGDLATSHKHGGEIQHYHKNMVGKEV